MDNYNYPPGADTPDAPWNQSEQEAQEVEVTLSTTLSKVCNILSTNYEAGRDEEGWCFDFDSNQTEAARESNLSAVDALNEAASVLQRIMDLHLLDAHLNLYKAVKAAKEGCEGWEEDEFEAYTN